MKGSFTLLYLLISISAFAQTGDTLFWAAGDGSIPALYRIPDPFISGDTAGYIAGTDQLNSSFTNGKKGGNSVSEDAQIFNDTGQVKLIGAKFCFGAKKYVSGDPNSRMLFRLYRNDSTYVNSDSQTVTGPGTLLTEVAVRLDSIKILLSGIDNLYTGSEQIIFPIPITVDSGYTFGICMDSLNSIDTIGLFTSKLGLPHPPNMSLVKFVGAGWANYSDTTNGWGYELDLAIFPIIDSAQQDTISDVRDLQQLKFDLRPNPARNVCTIFPGNVQGTWNGSLYNMQGQLIQYLFTAQDMQPFTFSTGLLPQGIYVIKMSTSDGKMGMQKLVVE